MKTLLVECIIDSNKDQVYVFPNLELGVFQCTKEILPYLKSISDDGRLWPYEICNIREAGINVAVVQLGFWKPRPLTENP